MVLVGRVNRADRCRAASCCSAPPSNPHESIPIFKAAPLPIPPLCPLWAALLLPRCLPPLLSSRLPARCASPELDLEGVRARFNGGRVRFVGEELNSQEEELDFMGGERQEGRPAATSIAVAWIPSSLSSWSWSRIADGEALPKRYQNRVL